MLEEIPIDEAVYSERYLSPPHSLKDSQANSQRSSCRKSRLHQHNDLHNSQQPQTYNVEQDIQTYLDMQVLNPDWNFAAKHAKATRPGLVVNHEQTEKCICCYRHINKEPVPLCQNSKQLQFLGFGFPLYFIFVKFAILILLVEIINYTAIELYWAINNNYDFCIKDIPREMDGELVHCTSFMILLATLDTELRQQEHIIRLTSFATLLLFLIYIRDRFTKTWQYYDERETKYSKFSIFIQNLPSKKYLGNDMTIGKRLRQFFGDQRLFPSKPRIAHINLIGEIQNIIRWEQSKKKLIHQLSVITRKNNELEVQEKQLESENSTIDKIKKKREILTGKKKIICRQIKELTDSITLQKIQLKQRLKSEDLNCDKAIVCFETQRQMKKILEQFTNISKADLDYYFFGKGKKIRVGKSARPKQLNWEYISVSENSRIKRKIISWLIFIFILGALTTGVYFLFDWKARLIQQADNGPAFAIVFLFIIGIIIFNKFIMSEIIHALVQFEVHKTTQNYQFSFMLKYSLGLFFTTAVMTILVEGVTEQNVHEEKFGIVEEETLFFFFVAFFVPLLWLVNPWYIHRYCKRKKHLNDSLLTQEEANTLMEDPVYIVGKRYGQVLQAFWFTFLYACVIPIGSIFILVGLSLFYWVDKYNLLRKSSIKKGISYKLSINALFLLQFALVIKPAGELIFDRLIRDEINVIPIIELSIGFIYLILPINTIILFFHPEKFHISELTYSELKAKNPFSYELYNPVSKQHELSKYAANLEDCSNSDHLHHQKGSIISEIQQHQEHKQKHIIVRPHESMKRKIDFFSASDFDGDSNHQQNREIVIQINEVQVQ